MLEKLYSPKEVLALFPEGHRTSLRRLIAKAKEANCCCKLGRGIGFTEEQVKALWVYLSQPSPNGGTRQQSRRVAPSVTYTNLRARLIKEKAEKKKR